MGWVREINMSTPIEIIDRGRGPQLSTSRITVQDLVPYLQMGSSHAEIMRAMPVLTEEDIRVVERYIEEHRDEVVEEDRRIREENALQKNPPEVEKILQAAHAQRLARTRARQQGRATEMNGEGHSC
jgi:uncharacterized protein (DUF433 family)